jgi:organic radical activating enzyme
VIYRVAERFKAVQGEGAYAGTPMAFVRFVGCSVGKSICAHCDTDFDKTYPWKDGGEYSEQLLLAWAKPFEHLLLTGGEPFDQALAAIVGALEQGNEVFGTRIRLHVETSGTVPMPRCISTMRPPFPHVCVSPKPGWLPEMIEIADEVKVIVPGLSDKSGWPSLDDALGWAEAGKTVFLQPRNAKHEINRENLRLCEQLVLQNPSLRLSVQLHKVLESR